MIHNTIVLCHMLLACFPWIGNLELAAVQLIFEHVLTFDALLGRIVLTHEGYNQAQKLLPQLLVPAARNNLVYPAELAPSFLNMFVIIQTIVDPLIANLTPEERTAVYATKHDAHKLSELSLDHLQADVDQWVCEYSELDPLRPLSITSPPLTIEDYAYTMSIRLAQSGAPLARKLAMRGANKQPDLNSKAARTDTPAATPDSSDYQSLTYNSEGSNPISALSSPTPSLQSRMCDLTAREHGDVWWSAVPPTQERSPPAQPGPCIVRKPAVRKMRNLEALCTPTSRASACATGSKRSVCTTPPCDGAPRGTASPVPPVSPGLLGVDGLNSYLCPWTTPSNARSLESLASSPTSFGPSTPMDRPRSPWEYPCSDMDHPVVFGSEASSEDLQVRAHIEVRKAEEATVQRKFVRKLKAALVVARLAYN